MMRKIQNCHASPHWLALLLIVAWCVLLLAPIARAQTPADWREVQHPTLDRVFVNREADLTGFDKVVIDPLSIWYIKRDDRAPDEVESDLAQLRSSFRSAFEASLESLGYMVVTEGGPGVLRLHAEVIDLKINEPPPGHNPWTGRYLFEVTSGHMTVVAEFQDSSTGEVLARIADRDETDVGSALSPDVWSQVQLAFDQWSGVFADTLTGIRSSHQATVANRSGQ